MKSQYENKIVSSFLLWLDNTIITKGVAYTNTSSRFYSMNKVYNGLYTYSAPFKQFLYDYSVSGATIITGVYINNSFVTTGQSGLSQIDYNNGRLYFSTGLSSSAVVSGSYSLKDFNVALSNLPDEKLLFETKYELRPRISRDATGLASDTLTYPVILVKDNGGENKPFAFGGHDTTESDIRIFVLSDSQFKLDAVGSILKDKVRSYLPVVLDSEMPFNNFGGLNRPFSYESVCSGKWASDNMIFIDRVTVSKFTIRSQDYTELTQINPEIFVGIVDFELSKPRFPRTE